MTVLSLLKNEMMLVEVLFYSKMLKSIGGKISNYPSKYFIITYQMLINYILSIFIEHFFKMCIFIYSRHLNGIEIILNLSENIIYIFFAYCFIYSECKMVIHLNFHTFEMKTNSELKGLRT